VSCVPYLAAGLPGAFAALYLKYRLVRIPIIEQYGINVGGRGAGFLRSLAFFRGDALFAFLLIPAAMLALARLLPRPWRMVLVGGSTVLAVALFYLDYVCFSAIGRLLSFSLASEALSWGRMDPASIPTYLTHLGTLAVLVLILSVGALCWWASKQSKNIEESPGAARRWRRATLCVAAVLGAFTALLWAPRAPATAYSESIVVTSLKNYVDWSDRSSGEFDRLSAPQLVQAYRTLTNAPSPQTDSRYWGKAQGSDLVFLVYETGPSRFMPIDGDMNDFPNARRLRERSFVALQHNTAYCHTDRAVFSLFSSWYPLSLTSSSVQAHINLNVPGIMRPLTSRGYQTAVYNPFLFRHFDDRAFELLGFQRRLVSDTFTGVIPLSFEERWSMDVSALGRLKQDMERWETQGQRFAVAFLPECGHSPFPQRDTHGPPESVEERGRAVMARQDAFLGQVVSILEEHHRLEQTIIVVTADHGVRASFEDPDMPTGMIDEYSYHVPLLIYAPQALSRPQTIPWLTSHIDVVPSVLDLLGVERQRNFEQGSPLWDSRLQERTTFFFGNHYFGADGYHTQGRFFMRSDVFDSVYQNDRLHFEGTNQVPASSPLYGKVTAFIRRMTGFQEAWTATLGKPAD
jgi:glucan phosphoethanolaminetransferase (alkaline phosphatase superfamily)